jgi:sugar phosphate isomerase/epimerase
VIIGAITNSWKEHIPHTDMARMVERVRNRGASHIELRQTFLGQYEQGSGDDWRPDIAGLERLSRTFPTMSFNLAAGYPCLSREQDPNEPVFQACLETAKRVNPVTPRLRLVDTKRAEGFWERPEDIPETALGVAALVKEAASQGVMLFLENGPQPIRSMTLLVQEVRKSLSPEEAAYFGLCLDPINSLRTDPDSDPVAELDAAPDDYIFMMHFKQTRGGEAYSSVGEGDLDYSRLLETLEAKRYQGLAVLEIPPQEEVFDNFRDSVEYLSAATGT